MDLLVRKMEAHEAAQTKKVAVKAFGPFEGFFVQKPADAFVAIIDGKIVGGLMYKFIESGGKKYGYVSFLFTDPDFKGQGVGKALMDKGIALLWEEGADALITFVRDDNVASWALFEKHGFKKASLSKFSRTVGFMGLIKPYVLSNCAISIGHEYYIAMPDERATELCKKQGGVGQIFIYVLLNMLLMMPMIVRDLSYIGNMAVVGLSVGAVFLGCVFSGYTATLFTDRRWNFRWVNGGIFVYPIVSLMGGFFPMIGGWYPDVYENTVKFRRDMALNAIGVWLFLIAVVLFRHLCENPASFLIYASNLAQILLVFRCLPIEVFESTGFGRVWKWNKAVLGILVAASIYLSFILY